MKPIGRNNYIQYLQTHGIHEYKIRGNEMSFPCPFGGCDDDHRQGEEYHCSFNLEKGVFHCFKCGAKGNIKTLQRYWGDK